MYYAGSSRLTHNENDHDFPKGDTSISRVLFEKLGVERSAEEEDENRKRQVSNLGLSCSKSNFFRDLTHDVGG